MKKLLAVAAAAFLILSLSSCKKDYICTCDFDAIDDMKIPLNDMSKKDAKDGCEAAEVTYSNVDPNVKCTLD